MSSITDALGKVAMQKKVFKTELDKEWITVLLELPLERRRQELKYCDLNSLAMAMKTYPHWQVSKMAEGMSSTIQAEFIKAVRIYKGELPFPKKNIKKVTITKTRYFLAIGAVFILLVMIFTLNQLFP